MKTPITKIALTIVVLLLCTTAFGQQKVIDYSHNNNYIGHNFIDSAKATPQQHAQLTKQEHIRSMQNDHYYYDYPFGKNIGVCFAGGGPKKSEIYEGNYWGDFSYKSILIDGDCDVEFSAIDVNEKNAADFIYRVIQNDTTELVNWTHPSVFKTTTDGKVRYAYLGRFKYKSEQVLKIEIYNIHKYTWHDAMLIDWRKVVPVKLQGLINYTSKLFHLPANGLMSRGLNDLARTPKRFGLWHIENKKKVFKPLPFNDFIVTRSRDDVRFRAEDSLKSITFFIENGRNTYNYTVVLKRDIESHKDSINFGEISDPFVLDKEFWKEPGKYTLTFTPKIHRHGGTPIYLLHNLDKTVNFTVLPPAHVVRVISESTVALIILVLVIVGGLIFSILRSQHKRKLNQEEQEKQIAALKLQSVRAQLNPHFIFNALAGIQNLVNKNAIEDANRYLTRFARLTRNVLDDGDKEFISVEQELSLLDDYLKMEQTRFNFKFSINIDDLDRQVEIPAMLLQPFVENAVKHGVSSLKEAGMVMINIIKQQNNIILSVQDNGKGFNPQKAIGVGIKLCRDRIALLNSIHKNTYISLQINSDNKGTLVAIELKNWL